MLGGRKFMHVSQGTKIWLRHSVILLMALGSAAYLCPAQQTYTQGAFSGPGRYTIQLVGSGKFLDLDMRDGSTVRQWDAGNLPNQQWDIVDAGYGYFYIRSASNGMTLDIEGGQSRDLAPVIATQTSNGESQMWRIVDMGDGTVQIISRLGKAIDLPDDSHKNGTRLQLWKVINGDVERFRLIRVSGFAPRRDEDRDAYRSPAGNAMDENGAYDFGYSTGVQDARANLWRNYARHKGQYDPQWEEPFIEGYYDGYDGGHLDTNRMRPDDRDSYNRAYQLALQDSQQGKRPDFTRYSGQFDRESRAAFRRGYEDGYHSNR
jgi:hypothetical protein